MENQSPSTVPISDLEPVPVTSTLYFAGYLRTQIGKLMRVQFLIGNSTVDRSGVLVSVGVDHIVLRPFDVNGFIICDLFSIRFVTVVDRPTLPVYNGMYNY
jgi:hypothetical protein